MKIIFKNRRKATFNGNGFFCAEEIFGIELNNGGDDDFGDEILRTRPGSGSGDLWV